MEEALKELGAGTDSRAGLAAGWYFASIAMATFGVLVCLFAQRVRRQDRSGLVPLRWIAVGYALFGTIAFFSREQNPHFLLFVTNGALAGLPTLGAGVRDAR